MLYDGALYWLVLWCNSMIISYILKFPTCWNCPTLPYWSSGNQSSQKTITCRPSLIHMLIQTCRINTLYRTLCLLYRLRWCPVYQEFPNSNSTEILNLTLSTTKYKVFLSTKLQEPGNEACSPSFSKSLISSEVYLSPTPAFISVTLQPQPDFYT